MNRSLIVALLAGLLGWAGAHPAAAQGTVRRHLVYFRDKAGTPYSLSQPQDFLSARSLARRQRQGIALSARDLPVNPAYVAQVRAVSGSPRVVYTSRWFNAAVIACDSTTLGRVRSLPIIAGAQTLSRSSAAPAKPGTAAPASTAPKAAPAGSQPALDLGSDVALRGQGDRATYGLAFRQNDMIGAVAMHDAGFRGEGMQIAVFDAGFPGADLIAGLRSLQQERRVAGTRNFVDGGKSVYQRDSHGTYCLSTMAGNQPGYFIGTAPKATYYLCITEDASSEKPIEEANWLAAAEYADSAGVDVISSSLGYTTFDVPARSYTYQDMNGRTAISSRAATIAARVGMLVVNSAGNEGTSAWHYISAPADADSIISVGAVDSLGNKAGFSSFGPTADGRIKPTLSTQGALAAVLTPSGVAIRGNGTSFSCPIMAGMATGFWQANPTLTAQQVISYLTRSASQATSPDNRLGYGIPNFPAALALVPPPPPKDPDPQPQPAEEPQLYPNPGSTGTLYLRLPPVYQGQPVRVRITDSRGALVRELSLEPSSTDTRTLPVGYLAKGVYNCRLEGAGQASRTVRFVQP